MAAITVTAGRRSYLVSEDASILFEAIVAGHAIDEVTGRSPAAPLELSVATRGAQVRTMAGGAFGVTGYAEEVVPDHDATAHVLDLRLACEGYRPATVSVTVPAGAPLPVAVPDVALRPVPVRVQGRVVRSSTDPSPVADAGVRIRDAAGADVASLRTPLAASHPAGAPVRSRTVNAAAVARALSAEARPGDDTIVLDSVAGLPQGALLELDVAHRLNYVTAAAVSAADRTVRLRLPLARGHAAGAPVRELTLGGPPGPPAATLARDADSGDGLVLLDAAPPAAALDLEIGPPGALDTELRRVGARTDADGFYALDGVGAIETISVVALDPGTNAPGPAAEATLRRGRRPTILDLQLAP
jgi:hypothetical protein